MSIIINFKDGTTAEMMGNPKEPVRNGGALLSKGGLAAVYKVKAKDGKTMALKMFNSSMPSDFITNLENNVKKGAPSSSFSWMKAMTVPMGPNKDRYGYLMDYNDTEKYTTLSSILRNRANFPTKEKQLETLIDLANAVHKLNSRGDCLNTLNDGSFLIDCREGKVLICDNEFVTPFGKTVPVSAGVKFTAPEVATKMFANDKYSDEYSLSVLIFMALTHSHPLEGKRRVEGVVTADLKQKMYETEPVFIFDPKDASNRPDPTVDANALYAWDRMPDYVKNLFVRTFTNGMKTKGVTREQVAAERENRATAEQWIEALNEWLGKLN